MKSKIRKTKSDEQIIYDQYKTHISIEKKYYQYLKKCYLFFPDL